MTQKQTIIWTALPNGIKDGKARLSVLISPRLEGDQEKTLLSEFPDFKNWPATLANIDFYAQIQGVPDEIKLVPDFNLYPELWEKIFTPGVYVYNYAFTDLKDYKLRTFPVKPTLQFLKEAYLAWADLGPGVPPNFEDLTNNQAFTDLIDTIPLPSRKGFQSELEGMLEGNKVLPTTLGKKENFEQVYKFYNRGQPTDSKPRPTPHDFDFHEGVAMLADHPTLMRALGLVLDFNMEIPPGPNGMIQFIPKWKPETVCTDLKPITHYWQVGSEFLARWQYASDLRDGFLDLADVKEVFNESNREFSIVQVDPDGALLKLMDFSYAMQGLQNKAYPLGMENETPLPSLRTGGLGLIRSGRAFELHQHLDNISVIDQNFAGNPDSKEELYAEELLRGYRVDIMDLTTGDDPHSLCWRLGKYLFKDGSQIPLKPEEGYVKSASATSQEELPEELYLHEMYFRWNGWSLCAERPNQTIVPASIPENDPHTGSYENVMRTNNEPLGEIDLQPLLEALPGSLPRLRFGHLYRLRVRAVDLAGNSLPAKHPDWNKATDVFSYKRYEPVSSPILVLRDSLSPGESLERMVIRSNYDTPAVEDNQRHVVPPKTSQEMAETHGEFDDFIGAGKDHQKGKNIALKEAGSLEDTEIIDTETGHLVELDEADKIRFEKIDSDSEEETQIVIHGEEQLVLPYLPDPMAEGAAIQGIPRLDHDWLPELEKVINSNFNLYVVKVPFDMDWPDAKSFRLRLAERNGKMNGSSCSESFFDDETQKAQWDAEHRELSIYLAKAEKVTLRYSSFLRLGHENLFALWDWLKNNKNFTIYLHAGALWLITPHRKLELVHAVQQPLCEPRLGNDVITKKTAIGQTRVDIRGTASLNAWSTEKIDLHGIWEEWDDTDRQGPKRIKDLKAHASEGTIPYQKNNDIDLSSDPHDLTHEFGDTRHRWVNYHLVATSRFREYFEPQGGVSIDFKRIGPDKRLNIENSARPAAPKVEYIVPSFGWKTSFKEDTLTRVRIGGGLRVYLDRPWFSSGDDELLGVVLPHGQGDHPQPEIPLNLQPYVTQCGLDPIWRTSLPGKTTNLTYSDFRGYQDHDEDLTLDELTQPSPPFILPHPIPIDSFEPVEGMRTAEPIMPPLGVIKDHVDVVGYTPEYNPERKLWFCDVQFNPDRLHTYYPFVRLGLARYQPYSIPGAELSRVIMTDFIQLVPTRALQVTKIGKFRNNVILSLSLSGYSPTFSRLDDPPTLSRYNIVTVTIEKHDEAITDEALGWEPITSTAVLSDTITLPATANPDRPGLVTWHQKIPLPISMWQKRGKHRLVIKEYEPHWADGDIVMDGDGKPKILRTPDKRIVYTDIVYLQDFKP